MNSLEELISFFRGIPKEEWCIGSFEDFSGNQTKRCAMGHLNHHLSGEAEPPAGWRIDIKMEPAYPILRKLGMDREKLVNTNNSAEEGKEKEAVIAYLERKLREVV